MAEIIAEAATASQISLSSRRSHDSMIPSCRLEQLRRPHTAYAQIHGDNNAAGYRKHWCDSSHHHQPRVRPQWSRIPTLTNFRQEPAHCRHHRHHHHDHQQQQPKSDDRPQTAPFDRGAKCVVFPSLAVITSDNPTETNDPDTATAGVQRQPFWEHPSELSLKVKYDTAKATGKEGATRPQQPTNKMKNHFCIGEQLRPLKEAAGWLPRVASAPANVGKSARNGSRVEDYLRRLEALHKQRLSGRVEDQAFCRPQKRHFPSKTTSYVFDHPLGMPDECCRKRCEFVSHEGMTLKSRRYFPQKNTTLIHFV